jgi:hypothetical protein
MFLISLGIIGLGEELKVRKIVGRTWITSTETNVREASHLDYNVWLAHFYSERPPLLTFVGVEVELSCHLTSVTLKSRSNQKPGYYGM